MNDDEAYQHHQTPLELARLLIPQTPITNNDILFEPFKGEGAFYNNFPAQNQKVWTEIREGRDYTTDVGQYDWVITNPPFKLDGAGGRTNAFWFLLDYFTDRARKGVAFLANDACFCTLTPNRLAKLEEKGWGITKLVVTAVKKWRGRYFYIVLERGRPTTVSYIPGNF